MQPLCSALLEDSTLAKYWTSRRAACIRRRDVQGILYGKHTRGLFGVVHVWSGTVVFANLYGEWVDEYKSEGRSFQESGPRWLRMGAAFLPSPDDFAVAPYPVLGRMVGQHRVPAPAAVDQIIFRPSTLAGVDVIRTAPSVEAV